MDGVLPKTQLSACFRSKGNAKANRSIKLHPVTQKPVFTTKTTTVATQRQKLRLNISAEAAKNGLHKMQHSSSYKHTQTWTTRKLKDRVMSDRAENDILL